MQPFNLLARRGLHTAAPLAALLESRSVVRFAGPDTIKFLQGLLTNDVRRFGDSKPDKPPPMYAALLTPQGRFLYDFFLYRPAREGDKLDRTGSPVEIFADVDSTVLDELLSALKRYRLRSKVEIDNVGEDFSCWQRFGGTEATGLDRAASASSSGNGHEWRWFKDPRLDCLGFRGIFPANTTPPLVEADKETEEKKYTLWRIENGVAEGSNEIPKGEAIPLEYNLVGLNAISFDKGCYVGQELVARTHHRGVIRKRLLPLRFVDDRKEEVEQKAVGLGSEVVDPASGKKVGSITATIGRRGLGLLRLEEAFKRSGSLCIQGQEDVKIEALKPDWWPNEWFQDYQQHTAFA